MSLEQKRREGKKVDRCKTKVELTHSRKKVRRHKTRRDEDEIRNRRWHLVGHQVVLKAGGGLKKRRLLTCLGGLQDAASGWRSRNKAQPRGGLTTVRGWGGSFGGQCEILVQLRRSSRC